MIGKCFAVLAIVAQIGFELCASSYVASPVVHAGCAASASIRSVSPSGQTRNIVARGKYPIALAHPGPALDGRIPVTSSHVQTPVQVKPTVRLPSVIPSQKTVAHSCTCYKTILRPRVHQQLITVPSVQRYVETSHTPVVENIHYEAYPVNSPDIFVNGIGCSNDLSAAPAVVAAASPIATYSSNC